MAVAWTATVVCWLFVFLTCLLFFRPAPGSADPTREAVLLAVETAATLLMGAVFLLLKPRGVAR